MFFVVQVVLVLTLQATLNVGSLALLTHLRRLRATFKSHFSTQSPIPTERYEITLKGNS